MADTSTIDWGQVNSQLQQGAGSNYNSSMLGDVQRNVSYGQGNNVDPNSLQDWINRVVNKANLANSNAPNSTYQANGQGGTTTSPTGQVNSLANPLPTIAGGGLPPAGTNNTSSISSSLPGSSTSNSNSSSYSTPSSDAASTYLAQQQAEGTSLFNSLMARANQSTSIDPNDPVIKSQMDAASAQGTQALRNYQSDQAEAAGPYANTTAQNNMMAQQLGQNLSGLQASLMANELQSRRNDIQSAMQTGAGLLTADQQNALNQELGLINANLAQNQQQIGAGEFTANLGLQNNQLSNYYNALYSGLV